MATKSAVTQDTDLPVIDLQVQGLEFDKSVGQGAYGIVFEVTTKAGKKCIAKKLHNILLQAPTQQQREYIHSKFHQECRILSGLNHPNIVSFVGVHYGRDQNDISLIMERLHSDLAKFFESHPDTNLATRLHILYNVSKGLCYLHSLTPPLIHRDLTAPNILLTEDLTAKIGDLGMSRYVDPRSIATLKLTQGPGNPFYMPPECRVQNPKYTVKLDMFSFGVLIAYSIMGSIPAAYDLSSLKMVIYSWFGKVEYKKRSSDVLQKMGEKHVLHPLVAECLRDRPEQRPPAEAVSSSLRELCLRHPRMSFIDACVTGNVGVVQELLECGADPNQMDENGMSSLHWASNKGHHEVVKVILASKAAVNTQDKSGQSPLWSASFHGHNKCVELLINGGALVDLQNEDGATALYVAAQNGDLKIVESLIGAKTAINIQTSNNQTALYVASMNGHDEVVRVLLAAKATVNTQTKSGEFPLWISSYNGHHTCAELLINAGANVDMQQEDGITALYVAAQNGHLRVVDLLIGAKTQIDVQKKGGVTPLHIACLNGHCEVVQALLAANADINIQTNNNRTALFQASRNGHDEVVKVLLAARATVNTQDKRGLTAHDVARQNGHTHVCKLLN